MGKACRIALAHKALCEKVGTGFSQEQCDNKHNKALATPQAID